MSLLGEPLSAEEVAAVKDRFPDFAGTLPDEAKFWTIEELEYFFGSNGQLRPRESSKVDAARSTLLTRARQRLAVEKVQEATVEYRAFCRHLRERGDAPSLPGAAACTAVARADSSSKSPLPLKAPLVLVRPLDWVGRSWTSEFWRREYGEEGTKFYARTPKFEHDRRAADLVAVEGTAAEFVDYMRAVQKMDPRCEEDNAVAYPRITCSNWHPFVGSGQALFEDVWRQLAPAAVQDFSIRWFKVFARVFGLDWLQYVARYYRVVMAPPGAVSRLHVEVHGAHTWFTQLEGSRLFYLFAPAEASRGLYQEAGENSEGPDPWATAVSPVDIFYPSQKRHPLFSNVKAQAVVLTPGETLLVPSGWFHYAVALDSSVTLEHPFWNAENRRHVIDSIREAFNYNNMPPELREQAARNFDSIREQIMDDDDDSEEED